MVGRSNVGKSALINAALNRKSIARVSGTPGKTQAIQFYLINGRFYLVDLPGYGYAKVPHSVRSTWGDLVHGYIESNEALKLIFLLLDVRRVPSDDDLRMHSWSLESGIPERILLTKSDKLSNSQLVKQKKMIAAELEKDERELIACSTVTKNGIADVRRQIAALL